MKMNNKDDIEKEEEEKRVLIELMKMQNEALKRVYKNTINKKED
jgi:hypothetical protein